MAEGTPFTITNCNIVSLAKEEKIGKNNKPYLLFKFKVDHPQAQDKEFAKFSFTTKPDDWPRVGKIISMTGKVKQSGQYTNYEVDTITYDPASKPPPAEEDPFGDLQNRTSDTRSESSDVIPVSSEAITVSQGTCISYVKDMAIARLAWVNHDKIQPLSEMARDVAETGALFYQDCLKYLKQGEKE